MGSRDGVLSEFSKCYCCNLLCNTETEFVLHLESIHHCQNLLVNSLLSQRHYRILTSLPILAHSRCAVCDHSFQQGSDSFAHFLSKHSISTAQSDIKLSRDAEDCARTHDDLATGTPLASSDSKDGSSENHDGKNAPQAERVLLTDSSLTSSNSRKAEVEVENGVDTQNPSKDAVDTLINQGVSTTLESSLTSRCSLNGQEKCQVCDTDFDSPPEFDQHISSQSHKDNVRSKLVSLIKGEQGFSVVRCTICNEVIPTLDALNIHISSVKHLKNVTKNGIETFFCLRCKKKTPNVDEYNTDSERHLKCPCLSGGCLPIDRAPMPGFSPVVCQICDVKSESIATLDTHILGKKHKSNISTTHVVEFFFCLRCAKKTRYVDEYIPGSKKDLKCPCSLSDSKTQLSVFSPVKCLLCDVTSKSIENLEAHIRGKRHKSNISQMVFACNLCDHDSSLVASFVETREPNIGSLKYSMVLECSNAKNHPLSSYVPVKRPPDPSLTPPVVPEVYCFDCSCLFSGYREEARKHRSCNSFKCLTCQLAVLKGDIYQHCYGHYLNIFIDLHEQGKMSLKCLVCSEDIDCRAGSIIHHEKTISHIFNIAVRSPSFLNDMVFNHSNAAFTNASILKLRPFICWCCSVCECKLSGLEAFKHVALHEKEFL